MIRHVVTFRFEAGTTRGDVEHLTRGLDSLPVEIGEIVSYVHGPDLSLVDGTWDYVLVADFASVADYRRYAAHPAHLAVIEQWVKPIAADIVRIQHELG